jgi:N-acyl-D-amino-acid deacylase
MHDLVVRNGLIVDGSGRPSFVGDIAVDGQIVSKVAKVGDPAIAPGHREIDAAGLLVTPGFVDVHTHYDAQVTWDPWLTPSSWHGVTTVVMGNCGVGFAPVRAERRDWLIGLMEGVEDIPGAAMSEGIQWEWESFPEYLDSVEQRHAVLDFGVQLAHGPLRAYVMDERGARNEAATGDDITQMAALVEEALRAGALGFSTSRTSLHKAVDGEFVPGTFAERDELFTIGAAMAAAGHGVFQLAAEHLDLPQELGWMRELAEQTGRTVSVNLNQNDRGPDIWKDVATQLGRAQDQGIGLIAQIPGRPVGILMAWESTMHPFKGTAVWAELAMLNRAERTQRLLHDPTIRAQMISVELPGFAAGSWRRIYIANDAEIDYEPDPALAIGAQAARGEATAAEMAFDALCADGGEGLLYLPFFNYADGNLDLLYRLHQHPGTRMGLADAGAHVGTICDGATPTFMLTHWTRDRTRGPKLPLELVVHRQTQQTAELFGLNDRGLLAVGMRADINVIDYAKLGSARPRLVHDLPAGAPRLVQPGHGYVATICAGVVTVDHDRFTGALPGRLVRGPQAAP